MTRAKPSKVDFSNSQQLQTRRMFIAINALKAKDQEILDIVILQTDEHTKDGLTRDWILKKLNANMHLAYAIQWFAFASILAGTGLYFAFKSKD